MKKLYHHPVCPFSRQVRVLLKELDISFSLVKEDYWQKSENFLKINPAGSLPVLEETFGLRICGIYVIIEYLNDKYPNFDFMDDDADIKCEIRRIVSWCNNKFYSEVIKIIINEKVIRLLLNQGTPRTNLLTIAKKNQTFHLDYLSNLLEMRSFLAGDKISCADIAGACHISILDYFGEINWDKWPNIRYWYAIIKSRPSFRQLLQDRIAGFIPYNTYMDLDF